MTTIVRRALTVADTEALEHLLEEGAGLYALTQLKREPKDFSAGAMKHERQRGSNPGLVPLGPTGVTAARPFPESIKYYASLVMYYSVYRLKRLDVWLRLLYLLCFVYHRYQRVHDHMLDSLIHHVRQYTDAAQAAAKDRVYTTRLEGNEHLAKAGHVLKLFTDEYIAPQTPFQDVQATAFGILGWPEMIADQITTRGRFDETAFQWDHLDGLAPQFKRHLRPVLLAVDFAAVAPHDPFLEAVQFCRRCCGKGAPSVNSPQRPFLSAGSPSK